MMLHLVYEDDVIVVINKASGVLSQPGKTRDNSIETQVRRSRDDARGPLLVHRLDMDTSGLLLLGKTRNAHRNLQQQFEHRQVFKRYTALIEHKPTSHGGLIELPLSKDWDNRPHQRVDFKKGKPATTAWRIADDCIGLPVGSPNCRVHLYPMTGRTHQLRVHMAQALGSAIVGDRLYGTAAARLMLHADRLSFNHPVSDVRTTLCVEASF